MSKILAIFRVPDMSIEQYDSITSELESLGKKKMKERPFHCAARMENGSVVADVWESKEALDKFFETLGPILAKNGVNPPPPEILPVHDILY